MEPQPYRINNHPFKNKIQFVFNGKKYSGFEGDTLASALLANGVHLVARGFKYHRPRGIFSSGIDEPNAFVQLEPESPYSEPNRRATDILLYEGLKAKSQNCWPGVNYDFRALSQAFKPLLSAGFYYKTFMKPEKLWPWYEKKIRQTAGLGVSPMQIDPDHYARRYAYCDTLIIGAGFSGLLSALLLAKSGIKIILCEQYDWGGTLNNESYDDPSVFIDKLPSQQWLDKTIDELKHHPNITLLPQTLAFAHYPNNYIGLIETHDAVKTKTTAKNPKQTLWQIRAESVIHATGQMERPLLFAGNDRPGIMLAQSVRHYLNRYGVLAGSKAVILTNNDQAYQCAIELANRGIEVNAIIDIRSDPEKHWLDLAEKHNIDVKTNSIITATRGWSRVKGISLKTPQGQHDIDCDLLAVCGGFIPVINLWSHAGGRVIYDENIGSYRPGEAVEKNQFSCGGINGTQSFRQVIKEVNDIGNRLLQNLGKPTTQLHLETDEPLFTSPAHLWCLVDCSDVKQMRQSFIDTASDVTIYDVHQAMDEGFCNVEHVKRYTTCGMAPDQGKSGNVNLFYLIAKFSQLPQAEIGTTTYRPPFTPISFGAIAAFDRGINALAPNRTTVIHDWHINHHAVFENVGNWWRPRYYQSFEGETMAQALQRESKAARQSAGMLDGSTLGKIDIQGKDAAVFLNRIYTNRWDTLKPGRCRYGVMLGEDGMIIDDGVTARFDQHHFHMTTTSGNAAMVMSWMEKWLQTEWPELDVYLTSVTEQWAVISLSGPNSQAILSQLLSNNSDIDAGQIKALDAKCGYLNHEGLEIPIRIFGIAFSGENGYEINVPAQFGKVLWEHIYQLGQPLGLTPYGTETMHLLRAEKGFIIIGQETDGTVTPFDLDMGWVVNLKKGDFIGCRSLYRSDSQRGDRKQLVGLLTHDPDLVIPEGANLIAEAEVDEPPVEIIGHVTSSYFSPNLGRSFALALLKSGKNYPNKTIYAADIGNKTTQAVDIVDACFI
ncbi:MAG: 2Fe-2S iron-sulfur cluster-binding protein [Francisellaceae bacterium]